MRSLLSIDDIDPLPTPVAGFGPPIHATPQQAPAPAAAVVDPWSKWQISDVLDVYGVPRRSGMPDKVVTAALTLHRNRVERAEQKTLNTIPKSAQAGAMTEAIAQGETVVAPETALDALLRQQREANDQRGLLLARLDKAAKVFGNVWVRNFVQITLGVSHFSDLLAPDIGPALDRLELAMFAANRQLGKSAKLALGYGTGAQALNPRKVMGIDAAKAGSNWVATDRQQELAETRAWAEEVARYRKE